MAAAIQIADIRLVSYGDRGLIVTAGVGGVCGWSSSSTIVSLVLVARRGSSGDGQDSGNDKLICNKERKRNESVLKENSNYIRYSVSCYQLHVDCCFSSFVGKLMVRIRKSWRLYTSLDIR